MLKKPALFLCGVFMALTAAASCCPHRACTAKGRAEPGPGASQAAPPGPGQPAAGIQAGGATPHSVETVGEAAEKAAESGRPPRGEVVIPKHTIRRDGAAESPGPSGTDNATQAVPDGAPSK